MTVVMNKDFVSGGKKRVELIYDPNHTLGKRGKGNYIVLGHRSTGYRSSLITTYKNLKLEGYKVSLIY